MGLCLAPTACVGKVDRGLDLKPAHDQPVLASIERTSCYGWCPVYRLTVFTDGVVEYIGVDFVLHKGWRSGKVSDEQLEQLQAVFEQYEFAGFAAAYEQADYTDFPTAITSFRLNGQLKRVVHYYGDTTAPPSLSNLEDAVERVLDIDQWIGTREQREIFAESW
ncbi:MAG: DUF6438 domain-containing protein [Nannocystaceae bacterium]